MNWTILPCLCKEVDDPAQREFSVFVPPPYLTIPIFFKIQVFFSPYLLFPVLLEKLQLPIFFIHDVIPDTGGFHLVNTLYPLFGFVCINLITEGAVIPCFFLCASIILVPVTKIPNGTLLADPYVLKIFIDCVRYKLRL